MKFYSTSHAFILVLTLFLSVINCFGQEHSNNELNVQSKFMHSDAVNVGSIDMIKNNIHLSSNQPQHNENEHLPTEKSFGDQLSINKQRTTTKEEEDHSEAVKIDSKPSDNYQQSCWHLPRPFETSLLLLEKQTLRFISLLPESSQTTFFGVVGGRETLRNSIWLTFIFIISSLISFIFLSMSIKYLKKVQTEKPIRVQYQQLRQSNDQTEFELAELQRKYEKLLSESSQIKTISDGYKDDILQWREKYRQLQEDINSKQEQCNALQKDIDNKQDALNKYEFDLQKQTEIVTHLNNEILQYQQELAKERQTIARLQSNDLSLERFEQLKQIIHELKSEIIQLKQDKFAQTDELQQVQERANQLEIDNNKLTIKMKQIKDLLEQKVNTESDEQQQRELLSTIDNDVEKANQHMRNLHLEIEEKTRRLKELDNLLNQEKDRCRELETKLKVVLELRERDAHLHIRQLGQTDSELRKARTDTERVRILQQQLELKQQQLDDVQKVLSSEQTKFSEECSKLQHETHEKWMEVKRLTRELDGAKKECEGLRRQITKYAQNDRSSQEKMNNTGRLSSEPETNRSSPSPLSYSDNSRSANRSNDSGMVSPTNRYSPKPPMLLFPRPCFQPRPMILPPMPSRFMLSSTFPMPFNGSKAMIVKNDFLSGDKNKI